MDLFDDFVPSKSAPALASLFGRKPQDPSTGKNAMVYSPPKQPIESKASPSPARETMSLVIMKSVHAFQLESGAFKPLGRKGLSVVGCKDPPNYQLLVYATKEDITARISLTSSFAFTLADNNYALFCDNNHQFSVLFSSAADVNEFATKVAEIKCQLCSEAELLFQDTAFSNSEAVPEDGQVAMTATAYKYVDGDQEVIDNRIDSKVELNPTLREKWPWLKSCDGIKYGVTRMVIAPQKFSEPWKDSIPTNGKLFLMVQFMSVSDRSLNISNSSTSSDVDNTKPELRECEQANSDQSEKVSQKASLLSRMARLGQPTLPLKGALAAELSDSDSDISVVRSPPHKPKPRTRTPVPTERESFPRPMRTEAMGNHQLQPMQLLPHFSHPVHSQMFMNNDGTFGQPVDITTHFAESRLQNAELRQGIFRLSEQLDHIKTQLQTNNVNPKTDPEGLLLSLQAVLQENVSLKNKVREQGEKIDVQNDRIFNLLEMNHKSLGQNQNSSNCGDLEEAKKKTQSLSEELAESERNLKICDCEKDDIRRKYDALSLEHEQLKISERVQKDSLEKEMAEISLLKEKVNEYSIQLQNQSSSFIEETKALMNATYRQCHSNFDEDLQYDGTTIKKILASIIRDKTNELLGKQAAPRPVVKDEVSVSSEYSKEVPPPIPDFDSDQREDFI